MFVMQHSVSGQSKFTLKKQDFLAHNLANLGWEMKKLIWDDLS